MIDKTDVDRFYLEQLVPAIVELYDRVGDPIASRVGWQGAPPHASLTPWPPGIGVTLARLLAEHLHEPELAKVAGDIIALIEPGAAAKDPWSAPDPFVYVMF